MALYLISYDILEKDLRYYRPLWDRLEKLGAQRVLHSEWLVKGETGKAKAIADQIVEHIRSKDRLLVQELTDDAAWYNVRVADDRLESLLDTARG